MHLQKSPKEKSCYTLPTVKKLLEEKRKKETSTAPPTCAAVSNTAGAIVPLPASTSALSASASSSYLDMAAMQYERWEASMPQCSSFPLGLSYNPSPSLNFPPAPVYNHSLPPAEPQATGYSPHQLQDCLDGQIQQHFAAVNCPTTTTLADNVEGPRTQSVTGQNSVYSWSGPPSPRTHASSGPYGLQLRTPMDMAKLEEARVFLQGMDYSRTTWQDDDGDTILHIYTAKGQREYAFAAAEKFQELHKLDSKEHKGKTALLVAVTANHPEIVQDLLSLGADLSMCDIKGQTALHLAATYGFPQVMQILLSMNHRVSLEARNFEGLTPLHCAVISHSATMKALCASSSASTWISDPSVQAQANNKLLCLKMLLDAGASPVSQEIKSSKTVLHLAVKEGNIQLVHFFLKVQIPDMQAFINMKAHGHTALHMAAGLHGNPYQEELIHLLLARGADPSIRNLENDQPAHLLQSGEQGDKLKLILKKRNASSRRRITSLQDQD